MLSEQPALDSCLYLPVLSSVLRWKPAFSQVFPKFSVSAFELVLVLSLVPE